MTVDDQTRPASLIAKALRGPRSAPGEFARRLLSGVVPPYARRRRREAAVAASLARLEADFKHVRERHDEQIERLEELVRELVLTAESLRRAGAAREGPGDG
jgi:hypothetical protein